MPDESSKILSYATPPPPPAPLVMRDSAEYYREPPELAEWSIGHGLLWIIAFLAVIVVAGYGLSR